MSQDGKFLPFVEDFDTAALPFKGFSAENKISYQADFQRYIDDAVKQMSRSVSSQVETRLREIIKAAFIGTCARYMFDDVELEERWNEFLALLIKSAADASREIEDRSDG